MDEKKQLSPSLEDYLEAILALEKRDRVARVKNIAEYLDVQMPSVTGALKILKNRDLIDYEKNSYIVLTDKGMKEAQAVQSRHSILKKFLLNIIFLPEAEAEQEACRLEHFLGIDAAKRIKNLTDYLENEMIKKQPDKKKWINMLDNLKD